jgi:hypothetical protein
MGKNDLLEHFYHIIPVKKWMPKVDKYFRRIENISRDFLDFRYSTRIPG